MNDSARKQFEQAAVARRILIVEDDDDSREMLVELIGMLGHRAMGAPNASDALRVAHDEQPDVVLIDIGLPDVSGVDFAKRLRATPNGANMRLVALTGYSDSATRQLAAEAGFDDFVVKPFSTENLASLLNHQL
ncbi:MAG TPA: response regulator [Polyangiaceae bacterium]